VPKRRAPTQTGGVANTGTINTEGGDVAGRDIVKIAINSPDEIVDALEKRGVLQTAENAGLQRRMVVMLAQRLKPAERLDFEQAITELERAVEIALDVIARGERGSNEDAFVDAVLAEVAEKTRNNDLDGGAKAIADALTAIDRRETAHRETVQRERIALLDAGIKQHTLRRDAVAVAAQIERSVAVQHATERPGWHPAFRARYGEYREDGEAKGINFSLEVAIECARRMLDMASDAEERGTATFLLDNALTTLGERESGTARLEQAVNAYRDALEERTRERVPLDWAKAQNNLGTALGKLGERESGTARLEQAVNALRNALLERTRERVPLQWAMTQNELGNALLALGERERGTARSEEAVNAYRDALLERTRERVPLQWAMTQHNLGNALATLGERESGTARLEQAVSAFRNALLEHTRERVPLRWATTQITLGTALSTLGGRKSGTARLEQAVNAYRNALLECTRERVPLLWATTQHNLGNALFRLGERVSGTARLAQAVDAYRNALQEFTQQQTPYYYSVAQDNLEGALEILRNRQAPP
jgi:tetratricopeptide (TPR) repeat protein